MFREVVCIWRGVAAGCVNAEVPVLMVLQGQPDEEKRWTVPSGQQDLHLDVAFLHTLENSLKFDPPDHRHRAKH